MKLTQYRVKIKKNQKKTVVGLSWSFIIIVIAIMALIIITILLLSISSHRNDLRTGPRNSLWSKLASLTHTMEAASLAGGVISCVL